VLNDFDADAQGSSYERYQHYYGGYGSATDDDPGDEPPARATGRGA
jgi:hypothetical protein